MSLLNKKKKKKPLRVAAHASGGEQSPYRPLFQVKRPPCVKTWNKGR